MSDGYDDAGSFGWNETAAYQADTRLNSSDESSLNASSNATEEIDSFYFYRTEQFTVLWLLFIVIVVGNTAVLASLSFGKKRKSRMNFFIKQLAFAGLSMIFFPAIIPAFAKILKSARDLLVGLISVLTDIAWRTTVAWVAGNVACKIIRFMQVVVTYSSTYVLVALSIDRYDAITKPMNFSGSWWRARVLVGTAWGLSVLFGVPIIFLYEEKLIQGTLQCWIDLGSPLRWQIYMSLVSFTLFVAPTLIIAACYAFIVFTIWSQGGTLQNGPTRELRRASARGLIPRAKIKTVKMTFVIVFVFIMCWSPYIIFDLLQVYGYIPASQTNIAVATFIQSLAPLNSAANPIIYCLFSTPFCKHVRNIPAVSWVSGWCTTIPQHCLGAESARNNGSRTTTTTTSLTAHSSQSRGQLAVLNSSTSKKRVMVSLVTESLDLGDLQKRSQYLEDCNKVTKKRNENLIKDNAILQERLKLMDAKNKKLQGKVAKTAFSKDRETLTADFSFESDKELCKVCEVKLESATMEEPMTIVTKSEVEKLEKDMQLLRDAFVAREKSWDRAAEQEQNYRRQIVRLYTEIINKNQLLERANNKLQNLGDELMYKDKELKSSRKEVSALKKQEKKKQRSVPRNVEKSPEKADAKREVSDAECKEKSKSKKDYKPLGSLTPSSQPSSPRGGHAEEFGKAT